MPVIRYRDVSGMPSALIGEADIAPADGLRLACELSSTASRLAGPSDRPRGVRPHPMLAHTTVSRPSTSDEARGAPGASAP